MIKCSDEAGPIGWNLGTPLCWLDTDLYSYDIPIDAYTKDLDDYVEVRARHIEFSQAGMSV